MISFDIDRAEGTARMSRGRRVLATIDFANYDGELYISWADSHEKGAASRLLMYLTVKLEPELITITPVSWAGAYWIRKLLRLFKKGKLRTPVQWDWFKDYPGWTWYDPPEPSLDELQREIEG